MTKKTGVLIHGCHLDTKGWREIVWGRPPAELGRVPRGVFVALQEGAELAIFGSGGSERGGKMEGEITRDFMLDNFSKLKEFKEFANVDLGEGVRQRISKISIPETHSKNTLEELRYAGDVFVKSGINRVILVSSPTHISRCLRDACKVFSDVVSPQFSVFAHNLFATPSDISYAGFTIDDVVIIEPPHRVDRDDFPLHEAAKRLLNVRPAQKAEFIERLGKLLKEFSA